MMKHIKLDGRKMLNQNIVHLYLKYNLNLPVYYGNNLDALYDILSTLDVKQVIELRYPNALIESLNDYGEALIEVFEDAAETNPNIQFIKKEETII